MWIFSCPSSSIPTYGRDWVTDDYQFEQSTRKPMSGHYLTFLTKPLKSWEQISSHFRISALFSFALAERILPRWFLWVRRLEVIWPEVECCTSWTRWSPWSRWSTWTGWLSWSSWSSWSLWSSTSWSSWSPWSWSCHGRHHGCLVCNYGCHGHQSCHHDCHVCPKMTTDRIPIAIVSRAVMVIMIWYDMVNMIFMAWGSYHHH